MVELENYTESDEFVWKMYLSEKETAQEKWNIKLHLKIIYFSISLNVALSIVCLFSLGIFYASCESGHIVNYYADNTVFTEDAKPRPKRASLTPYKEVRNYFPGFQ